MKATVCTRYGGPEFLQIQDLPRPECGPNDVLVKVMATPVSMADTMMRRGVPRFARLFLGLRRPKHSVIGTGYAGVVAETGANVSRVQPGDRVCGESGLKFGACAEYVLVSQDSAFAVLPENVRYDEAAPLADGAMTAMNFLTVVSHLKSGQKILIIGASGGIGTAAVQIAHRIGADVTAVCSGRNRSLVMELGADRVIDYTAEDFTRSPQQFDVVFDTVGVSSFDACKKVLTRDGVYLSPVLTLQTLCAMLRTSLAGRKKAKFSATGLLPPAELRGLLAEVLHLVQSKAIKTVLDRHYPLAQIVDAHRYVDTGHKRGNVIAMLE